MSESHTIDIVERTDLAVATFESLGLVKDKVAIAEKIGQQMRSLQASIAESADSNFEPFIAIELTEDIGIAALIKAFTAKKRSSIDHAYMNKSFWNQYGITELNARRFGQNSMSFARQDEGVFGGARAMVLGNEENVCSEIGLYHTDKNLNDQIKASKDTSLINPADYIILQAQRREAGESPLDVDSLTRFVQMDTKFVGNSTSIPGAQWGNGSRLCLEESDVSANPYAGVRFSVGQEA